MCLIIKILGLEPFLAQRARARLRRMMRGYRRLKAANKLGQIAAVKEVLTNTPVCEPTSYSLHFLGLEPKAAELSIRQFLLVRRVSTGLGEALLESIGSQHEPVRYALPKVWREVLRKQGFHVADCASAWLWAGFIALYLANGIVTAIKLSAMNVMELIHKKNRALGRYAFFDTLGSGNLPVQNEAGGNHDIVNWYLRWPQRAQNLENICHSVIDAKTRLITNIQITALSSPLRPFNSVIAELKFLLWSVAACARACLGILNATWWPALMFAEAAKARQIQFQQPKLLAREYLFHNSNWIYRPVWTYAAERKGSKVIFYFYSTNCEQFKTEGKYPSIPYGWQAMTWPHYLVWDDYQADFVRRAVGPATPMSVVGPIVFHAGASIMQSIPSNSIAVFDVQPMRDAIYQPLVLNLEYYVPRNANQFLHDIHQAIVLTNHIMILKRKRDVGSKAHPSYVQTSQSLSHSMHWMEINPDTSALTLIEKCCAIISAPFTSTALLGQSLGKPSIYYDPNGICNKNDRAAHGIAILSNEKELRNWLSALPQNSQL